MSQSVWQDAVVLEDRKATELELTEEEVENVKGYYVKRVSKYLEEGMRQVEEQIMG